MVRVTVMVAWAPPSPTEKLGALKLKTEVAGSSRPSSGSTRTRGVRVRVRAEPAAGRMRVRSQRAIQVVIERSLRCGRAGWSGGRVRAAGGWVKGFGGSAVRKVLRKRLNHRSEVEGRSQ